VKFTTWLQNHNAPLGHGVSEYWSGEKATEEWLRRASPYQKTDVQAKRRAQHSVEPIG